MQSQLPELKNVRYDFNKKGFFRTDNGMPVQWGDVGSYRRRRGLGKTARVGEATAPRGTFIQSLISSESGERPGILEHVLSRSNSLA